ncbi:GID complex subunit 4, VID24 [Coemansia sp. RSA 552]|nr:GID complex subunit 4, VID24 [Coemansia sp. RSA 552]
MPVITYRRANDMRSSRRRLSAGMAGTAMASAATVSLGSPRSSAFAGSRPGLARSHVALKDHHSYQRKLGPMERRASVRSTEPADTAGTQLGDDMPRASSSLPTSPDLPYFGQSRPHLLAVTSASPPLPPPDTEAGERTSAHTHCPEAAADGSAPAGEAGLCVGHATSTLSTGSEASHVWSPLAADSMDGVDDEQPCILDSDSMYYSDVDSITDELIIEDEEDAGEPLPTPEQLIFSQSWSTWPTPCHDLYSGSRFSGTQSNGTRSYNVTVSLKYVDMGVPELCGHFTICGLTSDLPRLTTYFDAHIVGTDTHGFITNQWDASVDTDRTHWGFFSAFRQYRSQFACKDFAYRLRPTDRHVFMRWKERFVVPNYKLSRISGASFDGFYYVCYDREEGSVAGYYYHRDSDHYQCLKLTHEKQTSFSHFELA